VAASSNGQAPPLSYVAVAGPPPFTTDNDGGVLEWFVPLLGRGARRAVRAGDHVPLDCGLVAGHPAFFQPSSEPPDVTPIGLPDDDTRKRQQAEQQRLAPTYGQKVTPCCPTCGTESEHAVILLPMPDQRALNNALSALDDGDPESWVERVRIEQEHESMAQAAHEQRLELQRLEAEFEASHPRCPEGTEPMPKPDTPTFVPLFYRTQGFR
jgi:hypothetical protein